ncbi:HAD family hydrolase [Kitasatospora sp. NPDC004615]|uniref:HAD family hydrolase n=1 Tax=Kitasatospora sp. NPDC004615 TaxID=3364017 RepID=UPI00368CAE1E
MPDTGAPAACRGLILDFVGVLTPDPAPMLRRWSLSQGLDADAWRRTLTTHPVVKELYAELEVGRLSQSEWNRLTAPILGLTEHENLMGRAWERVSPATEMIELAAAAREAGRTVAMLSNSFGLDPFDPYAACGVRDLFDVTVISELEGLAKPDPAIYRLVLDRMGLPAESCVFVDDHPANLPPAQELGIATVLADGRPDTLARISELLGLAAAAC